MRQTISQFRARRCCSAVASGLALAALASAAHGAELAGATLQVTHAPGAEACASDSELVERVLPLLQDGDPEQSQKLTVRIAFRRDADDFVAEVVVDGSARGVRVLSAPGPDCSALERQLAVMLALLLDPTRPEEPAPEPEPIAKPAPRPRPTPKASPAPPPPLAPRPIPTLRVKGSALASAGIALGVAGDPLPWGSLGLMVSRGPWAASLSAFGTLPASEPLSTGSVELLWLGGVAKPCVAVLGDPDGLAALGCGGLAAGVIRAQARGFEQVTPAAYRPFFAAGGGALVLAPISAALRGSFEASLLIPFERERFFIDDAGLAFETPPVGFWLGAGLAMTIW